MVLQQAQKQTRRALKGKKTALSTCIETYPGYDGEIDISGSNVIVVFDEEDLDLSFKFNFRGLEKDCRDCGIHIHTGMTCEDADLVGGHYWNSTKVDDPWTADGGSVYNSDSDGKALDSFQLNSGYDAKANIGHAVVIHAQDGRVRVGCGVLSKLDKAAKKCKAKKATKQVPVGPV